MAPEGGPPRLVQFRNIVVKLLGKIIPEAFYAVFAITFSSEFVGNVPHKKPRVVSHRIDQLVDDDGNLLPIDRCTHTMIVTHSVVIADSVVVHTHYLRIFLVQPRRACTGRCRKNRVDAVGIQLVHDLFQPIKMKFAFPRLISRP